MSSLSDRLATNSRTIADTDRTQARSTLRAALGPGILMAGAAVGVSHLIQSTRAGAEFGLLLLGLVLLACLLKYPFLEFGPRYAAATGEDLLVGYRRLGRWAISAYAIITAGTVWVIFAAVTVTTAALVSVVLGLTLSPSWLSLIVIGACALLLAVGQFKVLDLTMKIIMSALAASTVVAVIIAVGGLPAQESVSFSASPDVLWSAAGIAFALALLGWMPIPLDAAAWHSIWTLERASQTKVLPSVRHSVRDFQIGYVGATVLAASFLVLGALVMYGNSGFSDAGPVFAGQLIDMYAATLGSWSRPLIAVAALTTMFSTTLAVADAFPRVIQAIWHAMRTTPRERDTSFTTAPSTRGFYATALVVTCAGAMLIIHYFGAHFTALIDFVTTVSFLAAPILAWMTFRVVTSAHMPAEHRPGPALRALSWSGLAFLTGLSLAWAWWRFFG